MPFTADRVFMHPRYETLRGLGYSVAAAFFEINAAMLAERKSHEADRAFKEAGL